MKLTLMTITESDLKQYKKDMQEAFQKGAVEGGYPIDDNEQILPEEDINQSLSSKGAIAYKAVKNGEMVGGAIIVIDKKSKSGHLDFLYVKHGVQSQGIGKFIWFEIENRHPEIRIWETCTPYFEKRNLHFYVNVCKFYVTDYWNDRHKDPRCPFDENNDSGDDGMFGFRKEIN